MSEALPLTATLTLALGIGLAGTIFGFTYGSVLVARPFDRASDWVLVERLRNPQQPHVSVCVLRDNRVYACCAA